MKKIIRIYPYWENKKHSDISEHELFQTHYQCYWNIPIIREESLNHLIERCLREQQELFRWSFTAESMGSVRTLFRHSDIAEIRRRMK